MAILDPRDAARVTFRMREARHLLEGIELCPALYDLEKVTTKAIAILKGEDFLTELDSAAWVEETLRKQQQSTEVKPAKPKPKLALVKG